jgi:hypothetical protein
MQAVLASTGELLGLEVELPWVARLAEEAAGGQPLSTDLDAATVRLRVEREQRMFDVSGWEVLGRGIWRRGAEVVVADACSSGFALRVSTEAGLPEITARWRPSPAQRLAQVLLPARSRLLVRQVLLQYPLLWWAGVQGRSPLHTSLLSVGGQCLLLAGPSGVGKSSLVVAEMEHGAHVCSDNLVVSDGHWAWGLVEPLRVVGGTGRAMPHGRREVAVQDRLLTGRPDVVVVLRRDPSAARPYLQPCTEERAQRVLIAGTYAAGELRRYWQLAGLLSLATGLGEPHPDVRRTSHDLTSRLPCVELALGSAIGPHMTDLRPRLQELSC